MSVTRSLEALEAVEQAVCENAGDLKRACRYLGMSLYDLIHWMNRDEEVATKVKAAQLIGWASLESEAYRRAVKGVKEDVWYKGRVVGQKKVYSDGLLATMMKVRVPGYAPDGVAGSGVTVNVNLMPRADTYEEWLEQKERATGVIEGEYNVVDERSESTTRDSEQSERYAEVEEVSDEAKAVYRLMAPTEGLKDVL